jgi:Tfp pilus assembly protein FimT
MLRHLRRQLGVTVGELIAVVGLCSLLSAAMVPVASVIIGHHRLEAASRQLSFEVARARMQAVGQNVFVRIRLIGTDQYVRERSADGVTFVDDGLSVSPPAGQQVTAGETGTPVFNRQGLAPAGTTLFVSGPAGRHTLSISVLGRVTVS